MSIELLCWRRMTTKYTHRFTAIIHTSQISNSLVEISNQHFLCRMNCHMFNARIYICIYQSFFESTKQFYSLILHQTAPKLEERVMQNLWSPGCSTDFLWSMLWYMYIYLVMLIRSACQRKANARMQIKYLLMGTIFTFQSDPNNK